MQVKIDHTLDRASTKKTGWKSVQGLAGDQFHLAERFGVGGAQHAALGDDGGDVFGRSHVEGGIADADAVRSELLAAVMRDFDRRRAPRWEWRRRLGVAESMVDQGAAQ